MSLILSIVDLYSRLFCHYSLGYTKAMILTTFHSVSHLLTLAHGSWFLDDCHWLKI